MRGRFAQGQVGRSQRPAVARPLEDDRRSPRTHGERDLAGLPGPGPRVEREPPPVFVHPGALVRPEAPRLDPLDPAPAGQGQRVLARPGDAEHVPERVRAHRRFGLRLQDAHALGPRVEQARLLLRVLHEVVVELVLLGAEAPDVLVAFGADPVGHDPAVADLRDGGGPCRLALDHALEGPAGQAGRDRHALVLEHGGHDIHGLDLLGHVLPGAAPSRKLHDEGDPDQLVEHAPAVEPLAVVQELLAVVGQEDDQGVLVEPAVLQHLEEAAELLVAECDIAVVLGHQPLAIGGLEVVGARVPGGMAGRRVRLEHPVEGRGRRVGHVRVHGVHVQERGEATARFEPGEGRVHHHVGSHQLARLVVLAVEAGEEVEAPVEARLGAVDHRVGDRGPGGVTLRLEHLGDRRVRRIERVSELHRPVLAGEERRQDRSHRRLRPRGMGHRLVEHDRVLREGVQVRGGVARVAIGPGVVGPQRVHQVEDHEGRVVFRHGDPWRSPGGPHRRTGLFVPVRLEDQLHPPPRVLAEVHRPRNPGPVLGVGQRVEELRENRLRPSVAPDPDHELDAGLVLVLGGDRAGERETRSLGHVHREEVAAGRPRRQGAPNHVADPKRAAEVLEDSRLAFPGHTGLQEAAVRLKEIRRFRRRGARRGRQERRRHHDPLHDNDNSHQPSRGRRSPRTQNIHS